MKFKYICLCLCLCLCFLTPVTISAENSQPENHKNSLTLKQAVQLTLQSNYGIKHASKDVTISEFREKEASLFSNPEFEVELENFGGTGSLSGFDDSELNVKLSQHFELWGKRSIKKKIASLEKEMAENTLSKSKSKSVYETSIHYYKCNLLSQKLKIARQSEQVHKKNLDLISDQVAAGKKPVSDQRRYQIEYKKSIISRMAIETELKNSLFFLYSQWGTYPDKDTVTFQVETPDVMEKLSYYLKRLENNPELKVYSMRTAILNEELSLEKKRNRPDLSLTGGVKKFRGNNETAYILGVGVTIPVFNRNTMGQQVKKVQTEQYNILLESLTLKIKGDIESTYNNMAQSFFEIKMLKSALIPLTETEVESQQLSYSEGKSSVLDILSTALTANEIQLELAEKIYRYKLLESRLKYLTGMILPVS